jgi:DNA-binding IclR family transcriptional regulator
VRYAGRGGAASAAPRSVSRRITAIVLEVASSSGLTLTEIAQRTQLPPSTTHRLLAELVDGGLLERREDTYSLGRELPGFVGPYTLAAIVRSQVSLVLDDLATATGFSARLGVWNERGLSYLERPPDRCGGRCRAGLRTLPLHATAMGQVILAHAPAAVVQQVVEGSLPSYTTRTLTTERQLRHALAVTRRRGVAVAQDQLKEGECAIAAPVFAPHGGVVAALELATATAVDALRDARARLVVAARGLSRQLACSPAALPTGSGAAPLRWRADPTSAELSWWEAEVAG